MQSVLKDQPLWLGGLEWRCLAAKANRALYITKDIVDVRTYHEQGGKITWENCTLRQYLNGEFLCRFSSQEQAAILETTLANDNNAQYNTSGGNATKDKVFLLSLAEAQNHFSSDSDRVSNFNKSGSWWWLRSPGVGQNYAASVHINGYVGLDGYGVSRLGGGVRPALWLNLESAITLHK